MTPEDGPGEILVNLCCALNLCDGALSRVETVYAASQSYEDMNNLNMASVEIREAMKAIKEARDYMIQESTRPCDGKEGE